MIPVTIIKAIYIRKGPGVSFDYLGVIYPGGKQVNMDGTVAGESHKGINTWYYLVNANGDKQYYWGGGVSEIQAPQQPAPGADLHAEVPVGDAPAITYPQWMNDLQLPAIWNHATGKGVGVAVVDTGIAPNIADLPYNTNRFFTYTDTPLTDNNGHGTNCAGLVAARNKAGKYIGVAPDCNLFICKIAEQGDFDNPDQDAVRYANAINWCAGQPDVHVISISWGNMLNDPNMIGTIQQAVNNAVAKNKIIVAAIGDASAFGDPTLFYPACLQNVIAIGAIPVLQQLYPYVNDSLFAITSGMGITSYGIDTASTMLAGTSQANAIVAGIVALILEKNPTGFTPATVKAVLQKALQPVSYTFPFGQTQITRTLQVINGPLLLNQFL